MVTEGAPQGDETLDDHRDGPDAERKRLLKGAALGAILGLILALLGRMTRSRRDAEASPE